MLPHANLILAALDRRDNIALLLRPDTRGPVIEAASESLYRVTGRTPGSVRGRPLSVLAASDDSPAQTAAWAELGEAVAAGRNIDVELVLRDAGGASPLFGFGLTQVDNGRGGLAAVLIGRDITAARRRQESQANAQALLASVFLKVGAAVAVIRTDGALMTANPAFSKLVGYPLEALRRMHARVLTAAADLPSAIALHRRQLATGAPYEMELGIVRQDGSIVPVHLSSEMLEIGRSERYRVVTLQPRVAPATGRHDASVGRVQLLDLEALREAFGPEWARVADRILMLAERVLKRRLGPADLFARTTDQGFVIWYADGDDAANTARTASIARQIRVLLLSEFGDRAGTVTAVTALLDVSDQAGKPNPMALGALAGRLDARAADIAAQARRTIAEIAAAPPHRPATLIDRAGRTVPMSLVDLPPEAAARFAAAQMALPDGEPGALDQLRLGMAAARAAPFLAAGERHTVLLPLGCETLLDQRPRAAYLQALGGCAQALRGRLLPIVQDIGEQTSPRRLADALRLLRPLVRQIGLQLTGAPPQALLAQPPAMLVLDAQDGRPPDPALDAAIGAAAERRMHVLARLAGAAQLHDWRRRGATLFALPDARLPKP